MNEAPKKIWMVKEMCWLNHDQPSGDIPYIRADIVDELVEALKYCMRYNGYDFDETPAEVALKKLEDV